MRNLPLRVCALFLGLLWLLIAVIQVQATSTGVSATLGGITPPNAPLLKNADFECSTGYYTQTDTAGKIIHIPIDWKFVDINGTPGINSAHVTFTGSCTGIGQLERISGEDSLLVEAQDLQTGTPFDVAFYQQIPANIGSAYSLRGWMLTLCGGSSVPSDCPNGYYMDKLLGIDPTGGVDPTSDTVIWASNRHNFIEGDKKVGWTNLRISAIAQATTITVFARINSPFQWHTNHGFIDALSLIQAPLTAPVATNDSYSTNEDTVLSVSAPGVLGNDSDEFGDALTAVLVSGPAHGTLTFNANGSFTYTPAADFSGTDSFIYKANDGQANSNSATVSLTIVSAATQIGNLRAKIVALINSEALKSSNGQALTNKLDSALKQLHLGNTTAAIAQVQAGITQVNDYISSGKLTSAQGQPLIAAANALLHSLQVSASKARASADNATTQQLFLPLVNR